jgi:putative transferase (TIGR04331 family)
MNISENKVLITTALQETWKLDSGIQSVFLGEWCKLYSEYSSWSKVDSEVLPFHWDDRNKLKNDHDYLKGLYERILPLIGEKLNFLHGTNEPVQFWRIVLGPWLITYLPIVFDRWEMLRLAFEKNKKYTTAKFTENVEMSIAQHFSDFLELMQTDRWNFGLYQRILVDYYQDHINFFEVELPNIIFEKTSKSKTTVRSKLMNSVDKFFGFLGGKKGIMFYNSYFPPKKLILLNLSLYQIPRLFVNEFVYPSYQKSDSGLRNSIMLDFDKASDFEFFLGEQLFKDMPISYLENFKTIYEKANNILLQHKSILTANSYWCDEVFKFWAAKKQQSGTELIICQHGGSFPPLFDTFQHEEDISDKNVIWFKPYHYKHIQLAPTKVVKGKAIKNTDGNCAVLGYEGPRYSYRATAAGLTHQGLAFFEQTANFCDLLDETVKNKLKIRPYFEMGWETKQRYIDRFSDVTVDHKTSYKYFLQEAKLIVCTYPQTTFSEAMASGKPTILLYIPEFNELIPEAQELIEALQSVNIIFSDPLKAANHVNSNWDSIEEWWASEEVTKVKQLYFDTALKISNNWKNEWIQFLKHT